MKIIENRKVLVTIKRPDGTTEIVTHPKIDYMTPEIFKQMKKMMKVANRGDVLSYKNIKAVVEIEESDYRTSCKRCKTFLDTRKNYKQKEWMQVNGSKIQVDTYYCDDCKKLLYSLSITRA